MTLRDRVPGELLPDILLNGDSVELSKCGKTLSELVIEDGRCEMLLVLGTSLKSLGAAGIVKSLAKNTHESGGIVIYVDQSILHSLSWASYIDLQLVTDIEEWARSCLEDAWDPHSSLCCARQNHGNNVSPMITEEVLAIIEDALNENYVSSRVGASHPKGIAYMAPTASKAESRCDLAEASSLRHYRKVIETKCAVDIDKIAPRVILVVCYDVWAMIDARVLAELLVEACRANGLEKDTKARRETKSQFKPLRQCK
ncbi:hypothetical protein RSAG8_11596, partial [Rhizoctonia solani AG-8 WAC10335]